MSAMFEFCCLRCEYAELHAPSSYGLDELLIVHIQKSLWYINFTVNKATMKFYHVKFYECYTCSEEMTTTSSLILK